MDNRVLILRDDKNVSVNNVYRTIQVVDNNRPVSPINVIQEVTNIIQVTAGRVLGDRGDQGPPGTFPTSGSYTLNGSITASAFSGSFYGDGSHLIGASKWTGSSTISREGNVEITGSLKIRSGSNSIASFYDNGDGSIGNIIFHKTKGTGSYLDALEIPSFGRIFSPGNLFLDAGSNLIIQGNYLDQTSNRFVYRTRIGDLVAPDAWLHLRAGSTTIPSLKIDTGLDLLSLPQQGAVETSGSHLYYSPSNILRNRVAQIYSGSFNAFEIPYFDSNGFLTRDNNFSFSTNGVNSFYGSIGTVLIGTFSPGQSFLQGLYQRFTLYGYNSVCRIDLLNDGSITTIGRSIFTGSIESLTLQGTGSRMVEVDNTGSLSAQSQIVTAYITNSTIIGYLTTGSSWSSGTYIGPSFTGSYQGQFYNSGSYFYFAVADDLFLRMQSV